MSQKVNALPVGVQKVKFSAKEHLLPPFFGILVFLFVYGLLNYPILVAKSEYYLGNISKPQPISNSSPAAEISKNTSQILIPTLSIKAPIIYTESTDNAKIAFDLRSGVVHYGSTAMPGQKGNVVIFGHSSGLAWAPGDYKFIFTNLEKIKVNQQIVIDYLGVRYLYEVTDTKTVIPTDLSVLKSNGKAELSLITCTPVGTSKNRFVVQAKQTSPDPSKNAVFDTSKLVSPKTITSGN